MPNKQAGVSVLCCVDCGKRFEITDGERLFYEGKGWGLPKRCKACRNARKAHREKAEEEKTRQLAEQARQEHLEKALAACPFPRISVCNVPTADPVNTLFVIGNGFDRMHGVPSSYLHFRDTLGKSSELRQLLETYIQKEDLWADFEDSLAQLNVGAMVGVVDDFMDMFNAYDPDAQAADFFLAAEFAAMPAQMIADKLPKRFRRWVESLQPAADQKPLAGLLQEKSMYLNFNYTEFLETIYGIPSDRILYLHGCRKSKQPLILGHAPDADYPDYDISRHTPNYRSQGKRQMLYDAQETSMRYIGAYDDLLTKKTPGIIQSNHEFFGRLTNVRQIIVVGHSLSTVDHPYFHEIIKHVQAASKLKWFISWFSGDDIFRAMSFAQKMGIGRTQVALFRDRSE